MRPFARTSVFNTPISEFKVDPKSEAICSHLAKEIPAKGTINSSSWSVPVYHAGSGAAVVGVKAKPGSGAEKAKTLLEAWAAVPIPPDAAPAQGTDKHLVVWQPSSDKLWEFWELEKNATGEWTAGWGGAMNNVSMSEGAYSTSSYPGAQSSWGASASSISILAGLITFDDLKAGYIEHALAMACPWTANKVFVSPAKRTDGFNTEPFAIPEGARFALDPALDLDSLELPYFTLMMARAAQTYGIFMRDSAGSIPIYAQDPSSMDENPYSGPQGFWGGLSAKTLMERFPWQHLQLQEMAILPAV